GVFVLKHRYGTNAALFPPDCEVNDEAFFWVHIPSVMRTDDPNILYNTTGEFKEEGVKSLVSIPLIRQMNFAGALIIGTKELRKFEAKKIDVIQAFGNQISVALNNASLFEQVRRSEQLYADLYEHSPDMYHSVDRNGIVTSCNLTESQLLGLAKEEIIGKPLLQLYPPSERKHVEMNLKRIFELGQELKGIEGQIRRRDGTTILHPSCGGTSRTIGGRNMLT
ncbi:MAG: PAS domain S-box protein, partial [Ignavibacteriales bacterium]|nr:PAS domain S-box protein [Ignavibacteriales bacterium]